MEKTADAFRTISEVASDLDLPQHVLRFWESRFTQIRPLKRGGGRRYYRREDIELLRAIRQLLYGEGYTIKGVQKILKEQGVRGVVAAWQGGAEIVPPEELPLDIARQGATAAAPRRPDAVLEESDPDFAFAESDETFARLGENGGAALGPADYKVLETLLAELNECERLLGNARRPASAQ
jgi:DNA-binding transcriptional MerR regulator